MSKFIASLGVLLILIAIGIHELWKKAYQVTGIHK